jgi:hypothetical protein
MMFINDPGVEEKADKVLNALNLSCNLKYDEDTYRKFFFYLFPLKFINKSKDKQLALL